jgi:hypothetical protein
MRKDAIDIEVNKGLLAFGTEEEGAVGGVVHEEVFGEDGRATKMGSCGFMGPKVVFACAEPLPELLSPGT